WHEANERRVVLRVRIAAVHELGRRAGLAGHRESGNLGFRRRAMLLGNDALHNRRHLRRSFAAHDAAFDVRRNYEAPVVTVHGTNHPRLDVLAAVRHRADRRHDLQRRDANLVTHRYRRESAVVESFGPPDDAGILTGKIPRHRATESVQADEAGEPFGADLEPDFDRADVARPDDHLTER